MDVYLASNEILNSTIVFLFVLVLQIMFQSLLYFCGSWIIQQQKSMYPKGNHLQIQVSQWIKSKWLLFYTKWVTFQPYHSDKVTFWWDGNDICLHLINILSHRCISSVFSLTQQSTGMTYGSTFTNNTDYDQIPIL